MRVVLDTNVLVSGIFFDGPPARILEAWRDQRIRLVVSRAVLDEYEQVAVELARKHRGVDIGEILRLVLVTADFLVAPDLPEPVCTDHDDDKFLACAIAGSVPVIVAAIAVCCASMASPECESSLPGSSWIGSSSVHESAVEWRGWLDSNQRPAD